jgi:hypothetical protein
LKWFYDTFIGTAIRVACCGSLLERAYVAWSLTTDEHDEHKDLRGLGCRCVISYVHGRDGCCIGVRLLKSRLSLLEVSLVWS